MNSSVFDLMQQAVDIVATSAHPANKIAATIAGTDANHQAFALSRVNYWPEPIKAKIGMNTDIGNSSGTVHAETACVLAAPMTNGASLFVTDPPCPNCVKNFVEAGIKHLYIDHKGFDKDFAQRRGDDIRTMSLEICKNAGVSVTKVFRKEKRTEVIVDIKSGYTPAIEKPARVEKLNEAINSMLFSKLIELEKGFYKNRPFALAVAQGQLGKAYMVSAEIHPIAGFVSAALQEPEGKYNYLLQPVHRVLMTSARYGLKIMDGFLYSSRVPTARELVNMTGTGLTMISLGDRTAARDDYGLQALRQLTEVKILNVE